MPCIDDEANIFWDVKRLQVLSSYRWQYDPTPVQESQLDNVTVFNGNKYRIRAHE